ncbi:FimV/HubP family polar landmark protein [Lysobacter sp. LF1]|uniref:FimV/HubP family polar landmark protein n=1 Tax=Lysobacter stagni TaxID=3045172 RepID=A0ABT6XJH1_9GAMM|nr:FimV/HubP family polar landmark protein [Lysobacter sp. LF1]MDI9240309.1 FimV/HubP family polar landmark protein [Lysobacter sp. LF1]
MKQQLVRQSSARRYARTALALAMALASGAASALGLGQIEVKSRLGQPFLAEIPIVSSDPAELENLQAELASPLVFARVGLQPPMGVVAQLQFTSALDSRGNPVIRVTTEQPVSEPLLTFLVSVDWGQGRLVREYAALVDAPRTVSAPLQPAIEETVVSEPNTIEREPEAATPIAAEAPAPETPAEEAVAEALAREESADADNAIPATPQPEPPAQVAVATPPRAPVPQAGQALSDQYAVKRGDTLSEIAGRMQGEGFTLDQAMIALLRANPDAFIGGNINRLKAGAVLDVPVGDQLASVDAGQARRLVASQIQQWRDARRAVPQPALEGGAVAATSGAPAGGATAAASTASAGTASAAPDARLEIVPPGASRATQAGTQSGIDAGGEGEMLRQELQQNQETIAAREAEVKELKSRIADLEQLQQKQQQLMSMKDSELAAAQQRLAQANKQAASSETGGSALPWIIGGGALLLALVGGWWLRRRPAKPVFRAPTQPAATRPSIMDAFLKIDDEKVEPAVDAQPSEPATAEVAEASEASEPAFELTPQPARANARPAPARPAPAAPAAPIAPAWHVDASNGRRGHVEPSLAMQPGQERLELARAYLDLGDHDSARQLLSEVVINGDLAARQQASRMLQDLE